MIKKKANWSWPTFTDRVDVALTVIWGGLSGYAFGNRNWVTGVVLALIVVALFVSDRISAAQEKLRKVESELENEFVTDIRQNRQ